MYVSFVLLGVRLKLWVVSSVLLPLIGWAQPPQYNISLLAGNGTAGYLGDGGPATSSELSNPCGIALDSAGNIYIADQGNNRIRKISTPIPGGNINTVAGDGTEGFTGDGSAATSAEINLPCGIAVDPAGDIIFSQTDAGGTTNSAIREVSGGNITTLAGGNSTTPLGPGNIGDGGPAVDAEVSSPLGIALDSAGNIYIADTLNNAIREITTNGNIQTISSQFDRPEGLFVDPAGNIYVADTHDYCVRKIATNGVITTVAGVCGGTPGFSGDNGPATQASLNYPTGVAVDGGGNIYIVDSHNFRIRMVTASGTIYTIAGNGQDSIGGDGGLALNAPLNFPFSIVLGAEGVIYISDQQNNEIRMLTPVLGKPSINGAESASQFGAFVGSAAPGSWIEIYGSNLAVDSRLWTGADFNGPTAPTKLDGTTVSVGGLPAVISYISPGQVNALVPMSVQPGQQGVVVSNGGGTSAAYSMTINSLEPGLCQTTTNGVEYVTAVVNGTYTYISPSQPAQPGQVLNFFGVGFGPVSPAPPAGQTVTQLNSLTNSLQIQIGGVTAQLDYQGLAPDALGLYQFNVVVPNVPAGNQAVTFMLNGVAGTQTLYLTVQ
jgi:uncharacterized protein (TIGR03437 family)